MRQLLLKGLVESAREVVLDQEQSKYLVRVLRMKEGDSLRAADAEGREFDCAILDADPRRVRLSCAPKLAAEEKPQGGIRIALVQALPKGPKMDTIIRQAVEMGVELIVPLETRYCVQKENEPGAKELKLKRRSAIVAAARQQSGSPVDTRVAATQDLRTLPGLLEAEGFRSGRAIRILFHETKNGGEELHRILFGSENSIVVCVGPEGGFADDETAALVAMGFAIFHFEGPILRTETAALAAVSAAKTITAERKSWIISK